MQIRVSEFIARHLAEWGVRHIFLLTGGGAMFLNDALGHQPGLEIVCNHHEQACAMAAEAYARISGEIGVINVTTGPGGINALNGVFGAWTDSVPMLVLSGQVKRETCMRHTGATRLRQLGDQEADIVALAQPITKYASFVARPEDIRFELEKALHLATSGRPGPCWLDIPIDVQSAMIDPDELHAYTAEENSLPVSTVSDTEAQCREILAHLSRAQRPVVMAGTGVRVANALASFESVIRKLGIPVVTAWTHDLIASDDPLFCGRPGTIGTRAGNFTVQNADLLLVLGSRLNIRQTSYNWASFARHAFKIQVDIDAAELEKPMLKPDLPVQCDLRVFLEMLDCLLPGAFERHPEHAAWLQWCREREKRYPAVLPRHREYRGAINPYHFIEVLFEQLDENDIVACANAAACIVPFQAAKIKRGQRLFSNSGSASMGYDLPAAIGAYYGGLVMHGKQQRVICLAGDGSVMLNLQELQTIAHHRLPIKIFILNNQGYLSIRSSQSNFFGRLTGEGPNSGLSFPNFVTLGAAFGIPSQRFDQKDFSASTAEILEIEGPALVEVILDGAQPFEPRMASRQLPDGSIVSPALEDMFPFLESEELAQNMLSPVIPLSSSSSNQ